MTDASLSLAIAGDDGRFRCPWGARDPDLLRYHDEEWGHPLHGDRPLYEKVSLEGFQAGLSWLTILRRRPHFREVFAGFDLEAVAGMTGDDMERLLADPGIIRNRAKIEAAVTNARAALDIVRAEGDGAFDRLLWSFAPPRRAQEERPRGLQDIPPTSPESVAMSKELKRRGFRFVGPTTMYALMQATGMVDDHIVGCYRST